MSVRLHLHLLEIHIKKRGCQLRQPLFYGEVIPELLSNY